MRNTEQTQSLSTWIRSACILEATAKKPGNVHPEASFSDLTFEDFVGSAEVIAPILADAQNLGVGQTIYEAVRVTRERVGSNSNLGIVFLLTPLAAVPLETPLHKGLPRVLAGLTREDANWVYRAIRLAQPGGMGEVAEGDVSQGPTGTLLEMMQLAAERDRIAAEYASDFFITLNVGLPHLAGVVDFETDWERAIIELQLRLMAEYPDTLIARKCGTEVAEESARRAREVLNAGDLRTETGQRKLDDFDQWLRADGHRRNPGTTADLIAASLFAAFREGVIRSFV